MSYNINMDVINRNPKSHNEDDTKGQNSNTELDKIKKFLKSKIKGQRKQRISVFVLFIIMALITNAIVIFIYNIVETSPIRIYKKERKNTTDINREFGFSGVDANTFTPNVNFTVDFNSPLGYLSKMGEYEMFQTSIQYAIFMLGSSQKLIDYCRAHSIMGWLLIVLPITILSLLALSCTIPCCFGWTVMIGKCFKPIFRCIRKCNLLHILKSMCRCCCRCCKCYRQ